MSENDTANSEEVNAQVRALLDEAFAVFSVDEMNGAGRQPGSRLEVEKVSQLMREARNLNPTDPDLLEEIGEYEAICDEAFDRRFVGFKWLMYIVGVYAIFWLWSSYSNLKDKEDYTVEMSTRLYKSDLSSTKNYVARYDTVENKTSSDKKFLKKRKKHLEKLEDMEIEDYTKYLKKRANARAFNDFRSALWWIIMIVLYYLSNKAPVFLINKRQREIHVLMEGAGWLKKIIFFLLGLFIALPITDDYIIKDRNTGSILGSTTEISPMIIIKIMGIVIIAMFVLMMAIIAMPILTIVGYLRNYQYEKVDAIFDKAMSTIKGWLKLA